MATMAMGGPEVDTMQVQAALRAGARGWNAKGAEKNRLKFEQQRARRRGPTPEMFFAKQIDNTRLKKSDDPARKAEMRRFSAVVVVCFLLVMVYLLQHLYAINVGYNVEVEKQTVERLREENRQLRLTEAVLTDPQRIEGMARQMGMQQPGPGQVVRQDGSESGAPVLAEVQGIRSRD